MTDTRRLNTWTPVLAMLLAAAIVQPTMAAELSQPQRSQILSEANELYGQGRLAGTSDQAEAKQAFSAAAQKYQTLVDSGVANGKLCFNLANAYMQSGKLGRAIANYERAKMLMPDDRSVLANLAHARSLLPEANAAKEPLSVWQTVARWNSALSLSARLALALAAWIVVWAAAIGRMYVRSFRWRYVAIPGTAMSLACVVSLGYQWSQMPTSDRGIVVAQTVIHEGNGEAFAARYQQPLREGAEFDVLQRRDDWLNIRSPDGQSGWIRGKDVEIIAART